MALGKSLGNILGDYFGEETVVLNGSPNVTTLISIEDIEVSPHQTRSKFDVQKIQALAESIKVNGLIHPIVVIKKTVTQPGDKNFRLLVGERRWRATKELGEKAILATIREESSLSSAQQALITAKENLDREDLTPIELANTFRMLMQTQKIDEQGLADMLKASTQYVKNYLRLLTLAEPVKQALLDRKIGEGQARHLVGLEADTQVNYLQEIIEKELTVKEIINLIKQDQNLAAPTPPAPSKQIVHHLPQEVISRAQRLAEQFPKAKLQCSGDDKKGKIVIKWG